MLFIMYGEWRNSALTYDNKLVLSCLHTYVSMLLSGTDINGLSNGVILFLISFMGFQTSPMAIQY